MERGCESAQVGTRLTSVSVSLVLRQVSSAGRCLLIEFELPPVTTGMVGSGRLGLKVFLYCNQIQIEI